MYSFLSVVIKNLICNTLTLSAFSGGVLQFFQFPPVVDRHLNRFKGLKNFFDSKTRHLYEFSLSGIGAGMSLCAVVATSEVVTHDQS